MAELERASMNVHGAFLGQLRAYRKVEQWPMPAGYRERLAPNYLAQVYKGGTTAVEYARRWLRERGLQKCSPAQEMLSIMEAVDDAVLGSEADVINTISFEKLARRAYGLERAYETVHQDSDWRRPQGAKSWSSTAQWSLCERYDVRGASGLGPRVIKADEEVRQQMEKDALFHKYFTKW